MGLSKHSHPPSMGVFGDSRRPDDSGSRGRLGKLRSGRAPQVRRSPSHIRRRECSVSPAKPGNYTTPGLTYQARYRRLSVSQNEGGWYSAPAGTNSVMSRIRAVLLTGLVLAVGLGPATAHGTGGAKPVLQLVQRTPLKIQGNHFKPLERVRLTAVSTAGQAVAPTRSTRLGRVAATFGNYSAPLCHRLYVRAVGARGDRASLVVNPPPTLPVPCPG